MAHEDRQQSVGRAGETGARTGRNREAQPRPQDQTDQTPEPSRDQQWEPDGGEAFKTPLLPVYRAIVEYQRGADWWANRDELEWLQNWGHLFIREFSLKIKDAELLPMPLVKIEPLNIKTICSYQKRADGYGLKGVGIFNEKRLKDVPAYMKLGMLLKMLFRAWEDQRCRDTLFENERRQRWKELGLSITRTSITIKAGRRFHELLTAHQIEIPAGEIRLPKPKQRGRSTLKHWYCPCHQNAWVGAKTFEVRCLRCHQEFRPEDHLAK